MAQNSTSRNVRNVVILGKTGAGKSSVANAIVGRNEFTVVQSVGSVTKTTGHAEIQANYRGRKYDVKVVDTVGFFDTGVVTNQATIDSIRTYINEYIPEGINLLIFVFREGRFTPEERKTFEYIQEKFGSEISEISALIVTNCENFSENAREKVKKDMKENPVTKDIARFMKKGVYTVGFPDVKEIDPRMRPMFEDKIKQDATEIQNLIFKSQYTQLSRQRLQDDSFWSKCIIL